MSFRDLFGRCRWGAALCVLILSIALSACGDDSDGGDTNANNGGLDTGADIGEDVGHNGAPDAARNDADAAPDAAPDADASEQASIELAGSYETNWDQQVTITDETWTTVTPDADPSTFEQTIAEYDNDENFAITQNPDNAEFDAGKFNKEVWTEPDGEGVFYHCTVDFGHDTVEDARNSEETADDSDPENGGCGGFAWTKLTPQ